MALILSISPTYAMTPNSRFGFDFILDMVGGFGYFDAIILGQDINASVDHKLSINGSSEFLGDINITGTVFGASPVKIAGINISDNSFSHTENTNASLRFSITNLNDGENATAIISAKNDVGAAMSIGIGSSNFKLGAINYNNVTALFSRSSGKMVFANFFKQAFVWLYNPSDDNDPDNLVELMRLDENGLNVTGNITGNQIYGEVWFQNTTNPKSVNLTTKNTWFDVDGLNRGNNNGFDFNGNVTLDTTVSGVYRAFFTTGYEANEESRITISIFKSGEEITKLTKTRTMGIAGKLEVINFSIGMGTQSSGDLDSLSMPDSDELIITGETGAPSFDINFTCNVSDVLPPLRINFEGRYDGNSAHEVELKVFNFTNGSFVDVVDTVKDIPHTGTTPISRSFSLPNNQDIVSNEEAIVQIIHITSGSTQDEIAVDELTCSRRRSGASVTNGAIIRLKVGDELKFRMMSNMDNTNVLLDNFNFNLVRIGD